MSATVVHIKNSFCERAISAKLRRALILACVVVAASACSTLQPPDANGPRANARPYPVIVSDDETRDAGLLAWKNLSKLNGVATSAEPRFNALTGTLESLPPNGTAQITLPKIGSGSELTEEEIRESLRRFIDAWHEIIGAQPSQLSLVERVDEPSGIKLARYEQRPFRIPLRGGFGNLLIRFRSDRHVVELTSNCIPNTDRLQPSLAALIPKVSWEEAASHVVGRQITIPDSNQRSQTFTIPAGTQVEVRQLVVYALPSADQQSLDLHLAWEIGVPNGAIKTIYLDAITDEVISGS